MTPQSSPPAARYRKRPIVIEAVQFTGANIEEIAAFTGETPPHQSLAVLGEAELFKITTLEGELFAAPGDWIIRGVQGEYYPCKPDIFAQTYERWDDFEPPRGLPIENPCVRCGSETGSPKVRACKVCIEKEPA